MSPQRRTALVSVFAAAALVALKLGTGVATGSLGLISEAMHSGTDLVGSVAVLAGLVLARSGWADGDSVPAPFVAALVLVAAFRLMRRNVDVLMGRAPVEAEDAALAAIARIDPPVEVRRLRMRQAAGHHFADVVIGVSPGAAVGQGHAAADAVEDALHRALPESDVVVHVEPAGDEAAIRERAHAAALGVPRVREIHNLSVVDVGGRTELSLHLKLPGDLPLDVAHGVAEEVERAICAAVPEIDAVQTHLEPLAEPTAAAEVNLDRSTIARIVREATGLEPREIRFLRTTEGLVAFLTLQLDPSAPLAEAHARASEIEERIRAQAPEIADVIVHTEP